jgi:NAD(P)H dehydrogenase (quinone)
MAHVHVVYAHPAEHSFTREILDAFVAGCGQAGFTSTISDLYAMGFRSELSAREYAREAAHDVDAPVPDDVAAEQERLRAAQAWAFVYPVWWSDCPAILKGWFDRVWTVGFAHPSPGPTIARRALVLATAGYSEAQLTASGHHQAMAAVMLGDRIAGRATSAQFVVFGGSVLRSSDPDGWATLRTEHLARASDLGRSIG